MDNTNDTPVTPDQMQGEDAKKKGKIPPQFLKKMGKAAGGKGMKGGKAMKGGKGASKGKMGGY